MLKLDDGDVDDAIIVIEGEIFSGSLFTTGSESAGFATVLNPIATGAADKFFETDFENLYGAVGDCNADGILDLALARQSGEFTISFGDGMTGFVSSGRSWQLSAAISGGLSGGGIAAADLNRDGLAEIFQSDKGTFPRNLVFWNNASR